MTRPNDYDFKNFYNKTLIPIISSLEKNRRNWFIYNFIFMVVATIILYHIASIQLKALELLNVLNCFIIFIILIIFEIGIVNLLIRALKADIKNAIISQILTFTGELYFCDKENAVEESEIEDFGLFPAFSDKFDDDVIVGTHQGCKFLINECNLTYSIANIAKISEFNGLLIKIIMNKKFSGETIVAPKNKIVKKDYFEDVKLESIEFMKGRKIYSTNQIEARYILTPSFIERLDKLTVFESSNTNQKNNISAIFTKGFVYLFVPAKIDYFDVSLKRNLLDYNEYYKIFKEINYILDVIEYLQLNKNIGL